MEISDVLKLNHYPRFVALDNKVAIAKNDNGARQAPSEIDREKDAILLLTTGG